MMHSSQAEIDYEQILNSEVQWEQFLRKHNGSRGMLELLRRKLEEAERESRELRAELELPLIDVVHNDFPGFD